MEHVKKVRKLQIILTNIINWDYATGILGLLACIIRFFVHYLLQIPQEVGPHVSAVCCMLYLGLRTVLFELSRSIFSRRMLIARFDMPHKHSIQVYVRQIWQVE